MQFEVLVDAGANAADFVARSDDLLAAMVRRAAEDVCPKAWGYWTTVQGAANQAKILGISKSQRVELFRKFLGRRSGTPAAIQTALLEAVKFDKKTGYVAHPSGGSTP